MTSLKCWNSGVESNGSAFILSPLGCGVFSRVPAVSEEEAASSILLVFAGQLLVGDPASDDLLHYSDEAFRIGRLTVVVSKRLFVNVPKQVEWLHADVRAVQAALQETPEVLHRVGMDVAVHILHSVIDDGVLIIVFKSVVGLQFVGEYRSPGFDVLPDLFLQFRLAAVINDHRPHIAVAFDHSKYHRLVLPACASNNALTFRLVHVPRLAADEGLINLDFATKFVEPTFLHRQTNAMKHKPRSFLSDPKTPMDFIAADTVFATDNQPCSSKPLLKRDRRIFKDSSSLQRERGPQVSGIAFPYALFGEPRYLLGAALRALHDTIGPSQFHHELSAVIEVREPDDRVSEGVRRFHVSSMRPTSWNVKYIIALNCADGIVGLDCPKPSKTLMGNQRSVQRHARRFIPQAVAIRSL